MKRKSGLTQNKKCVLPHRRSTRILEKICSLRNLSLEQTFHYFNFLFETIFPKVLISIIYDYYETRINLLELECLKRIHIHLENPYSFFLIYDETKKKFFRSQKID